MMNEFHIILEKKKQLTNDVFQLDFTRPERFSYQAGQFVQFQVPEGEKALWRAYSLSSTPIDSHLEFCVKFLPDGKCSAMFEKLAVGEAVIIRGPNGHFIHTNSPTDLFFVATGVGIAPIFGIIRDELQNKGNSNSIRLLFGVRHEDDMFWADRLDELQGAYPNFEYQLTLSQPKPNGSWSGLKGRVTDHVMHHLAHEEFYLCGSAAMVKDVRQLLLDNSIQKTQIHFEIF